MSVPEHHQDDFPSGVTRRNFLKVSSAMVTLPFLTSVGAKASVNNEANKAASTEVTERVVQTCSTFDCGGIR